MKNIHLINGPNLNLLGTREPEIYGTIKYEELMQELSKYLKAKGLILISNQSNQEGDIIDWIHKAYENSKCIGLIINPGGYTHTSVSIRDAILSIKLKIVEVHVTDPSKREEFRQRNLISDIVSDSIIGHGTDGYFEAIDYLIDNEK
jgi:3-dehydroquinate dehydratase-2